MHPAGFILWLNICLWPLALLQAQDVDTLYLKLQESYTQRVQDISQNHKKNQREYLNKFILALVRIEQGYRDEGELGGVILCRDLREQLLLNPEIPDIDPEAPVEISDLQKALLSKRREATRKYQIELDKVNFMLLTALEPYQREYTRLGNTEKAREIQELRTLLTELHANSEAEARSKQTLSSNLSANPNIYPFAFEGNGYENRRGVIPRTCMIDLTPTVTGVIKSSPLGIRFINGRVTFPANECGPLLQDLARNRMFSAEIAFQPFFDYQGAPTNPVVIFQMGENPDAAQFSLTLEGRELYLYFMTDSPPSDRLNHRYLVETLNGTSPVHLVVSYRSGELTLYLNGTEKRQLRNEVKGAFTNWEETPIVVGKALYHPNGGFILPFRGVLHHVYLKAGELSSRQVTAHYNRFLLIFD
ncbi:hypothetical protein P0Y35_12355 [Kiritimatiellaeota bacterium B1221]|nr:hypothetical protein [Kiritimatiellaeota bacterium B1221]